MLKRLAAALIVFALAGAGIAPLAAPAFAAEKPKGKKDEEKPPPPDPALVECKVPFRPATTLDGATATEEQINAYYSAVRRYQEQLADYRACLDKKIEAAKAADDRVQLEALNKLYDDSVTSEEQVVGAFNAALKAYRERHPS